MSLERLDHIVSGALFDFGGYLTTRNERLTASATDNAAPVADAITAFLKLRGVDTECEPFFQWPARCSMANDTKTPNRIQAAFEILKSAMRDEPGYAWTWHCNIAVASADEGLTHAASNAAAARFMKLCFDVDTSKPPTGPVEPEEPKKCPCGDRPATDCDETWGPKCDMGNNETFARPITKPSP